MVFLNAIALNYHYFTVVNCSLAKCILIHGAEDTVYRSDMSSFLSFSLSVCVAERPHLLYEADSYAASPPAPWECNSETKSCYTTTAAASSSDYSMFMPVCVRVCVRVCVCVCVCVRGVCSHLCLFLPD